MMKAEVSCDCVLEFFNLALAKLCTGENQQFEFAERKYMSLSRNVLWASEAIFSSASQNAVLACSVVTAVFALFCSC